MPELPKSFYLSEKEDALIILDQTLLPSRTEYRRLTELDEVFEAIRELRVRGAPAIGITAAYGVYLAMRNFRADNEASDRARSQARIIDDFYSEFKKAKEYLASSRPTAVNLFWALDRLETALVKEMSRLQESSLPHDEVVRRLIAVLRDEADAINSEDIEVCRRIGEHALTLLHDGMGVLTHCNAGTIATAKYGTALAPIYLGAEKGYRFKVYVDESRPLLQGARLTTWELHQAGVDVVLICDNTASSVMRQGKVEAVIVGCDRVAANGDTANKIGTAGLALLAVHYGIPFYVAAPLSSIDRDCPSGEEITIEERPPEEITEKWYVRRMAPENITVYNPAFDVTDHQLISAFITEEGIIYPPYGKHLSKNRCY